MFHLKKNLPPQEGHHEVISLHDPTGSTSGRGLGYVKVSLKLHRKFIQNLTFKKCLAKIWRPNKLSMSKIAVE